MNEADASVHPSKDALMSSYLPTTVMEGELMTNNNNISLTILCDSIYELLLYGCVSSKIDFSEVFS